MEITEKRVQTPRGNFRIAFKSEKEANENGFYIWFEHNGQKIVADGERAFAIDYEGDAIKWKAKK